MTKIAKLDKSFNNPYFLHRSCHQVPSKVFPLSGLVKEASGRPQLPNFSEFGPLIARRRPTSMADTVHTL